MGCCGLKTTNTETSPVVIGAPNGELYHVKATIYLLGYRAGTLMWVTGQDVPNLISIGYLVEL